MISRCAKTLKRKTNAGNETRPQGKRKLNNEKCSERPRQKRLYVVVVTLNSIRATKTDTEQRIIGMLLRDNNIIILLDLVFSSSHQDHPHHPPLIRQPTQRKRPLRIFFHRKSEFTPVYCKHSIPLLVFRYFRSRTRPLAPPPGDWKCTFSRHSSPLFFVQHRTPTSTPVA